MKKATHFLLSSIGLKAECIVSFLIAQWLKRCVAAHRDMEFAVNVFLTNAKNPGTLALTRETSMSTLLQVSIAGDILGHELPVQLRRIGYSGAARSSPAHLTGVASRSDSIFLYLFTHTGARSQGYGRSLEKKRQYRKTQLGTFLAEVIVRYKEALPFCTLASMTAGDVKKDCAAMRSGAGKIRSPRYQWSSKPKLR